MSDRHSRDRWRLACIAMIACSLLSFILSPGRAINFDAGVLSACAAVGCFLFTFPRDRR